MSPEQPAGTLRPLRRRGDASATQGEGSGEDFACLLGGRPSAGEDVGPSQDSQTTSHVKGGGGVQPTCSGGKRDLARQPHIRLASTRRRLWPLFSRRTKPVPCYLLFFRVAAALPPVTFALLYQATEEL